MFDEVGGPEVLRVADVDLGEPGAGEVRIRVDSIGVNRSEAMFRAGTYYLQPQLPAARLGFEAAGEVEAVGAGVSGLAPGDLVSTIAGFSPRDYGVYGEQAIVPASSVLHRPEAVDAVTGAAVWMTHSTAYGALVERGQMRPGDVVVITAASSGVGLAAIQITNRIGAIPIATTRTAAKRQRLLDAGAAHVIALDEGDLVERVRALTDGRGADLVFDPVAGPGVTDLVYASAPGARVIIYGWLDLKATPLPLTGGNISIVSYGNTYVTSSPERLRRVEHFINAGLRSGALAPTIDRTFEDLSDIVEAHRHLESNTQVGKIIVKVRH